MGPGTTLGVYLKAISSSASLLLLLLLHFHEGIITGASVAFPSTRVETEQKCDKVVSLETLELLSYLGNVTFTVPTPFQGRWTTVIKFTSPYTFIGGWGVKVQSFGRKGYAVFEGNEEQQLDKGEPVVFQFRVLYARNAKVPKVLSLRWQDLSICGPPMLKNSDHVIKTTATSYSRENEDPKSVISAVAGQELDGYVITNNVRFPEN